MITIKQFVLIAFKIDKWNSAFLEASVKTDKNVNQIFIELVRLIDKWREVQGMQDDKKVKTKRRAWTLLWEDI